MLRQRVQVAQVLYEVVFLDDGISFFFVFSFFSPGVFQDVNSSGSRFQKLPSLVSAKIGDDV